MPVAGGRPISIEENIHNQTLELSINEVHDLGPFKPLGTIEAPLNLSVPYCRDVHHVAPLCWEVYYDLQL